MYPLQICIAIVLLEWADMNDLLYLDHTNPDYPVWKLF